MEEQPQGNQAGTDQLTEEIIAHSLNLNDWLEQIQPEQRQPVLRAVPGGAGQASKAPKFWTALLKFGRRVLSLFRRRQFIKTLQISQFGYATEAFWGGRCDVPTANSRFRGRMLLVQGWVIGKPAPVVALRLVVNRTCIREIPVDVSRPDVGRAFQFLPTGNFGFETLLDLHELPVEGLLRLDAVLANQQVEALALIEFYRY